jgi:hypothetical protein
MADLVFSQQRDVDLMVDLAPDEIAMYGRQLAGVAEAYDEVEERKADVAKDFKEQLQNLRGEIRRLARLVRTKKEKRTIACGVAMHTPTVGTKTIVRIDTGEIVREEAMSETEMQERLFEETQGPKPAAKDKPPKGPKVN